MRTASRATLSVALLAMLVACGDSGGGDAAPACATHEDCPAKQSCEAGACTPLTSPACRRDVDCEGGQVCTTELCERPIPECDLEANVARRAAIAAGQPALVVGASSGKTVKTFTLTFASVAGDPTVRCPVDLQFKDLNGDGALQPYEDWTLAAAERAADLLSRLDRSHRLALLAHPALTDVPAPDAPGLSEQTGALVDAGLRFGLTSASTSSPIRRAAWANALQERAEAGGLGIPFVLSMEPAHSSGNGRVRAKGFSAWPGEAGLGATGDLDLVEAFGRTVSQEYRAIGVRMAISPTANLATDPRWYLSQFSYGEDRAAVSERVGRFVRGAQGEVLGRGSVAVVIGSFPGAGASKDGWDARLEKGRYFTYPGNRFDDHVGAFAGALEAGVAAVMPGYGIPEAGPWTGLGGLVDGASVEQVAASFSQDLLGDVLRGRLGFGGLVVAPAGVLEEPGVSPLGAPWGVEGLTRPQRIAKAVAAGVDQFVGLSDPAALAAADIADARLDVAATRALTLVFRLGLFEDPYVDVAASNGLVNGDEAYWNGVLAMYDAMVLVRNVTKPPGWFNGNGDGTQTGDGDNAGNGTMRVLPAPIMSVYLMGGCDFFFAGDFDLDYVRSVGNGYGVLTNDANWVKGVTVSTDAERIALSDYVFVRIAAPYTPDPDSGVLGYALPSLTFAGNDPAVLAPVTAARAAIDGWTGTPASKAKLVVIVDGGRPSVVSELLSPAYGVSALYVDWTGRMADGNPVADKAVMDLVFGVVDGKGRLPFGLPASDAAAASQLEDVPGDGADATFVRGFGYPTTAF